MLRLLREDGEGDLVAHIKRFSFVWESESIFKEIIKKIFKDCKRPATFIRVAKAASLRYKVGAILERKLLQVMESALRIEVNLDIRQIFGVELVFLPCKSSNLRAYYSMLEERIYSNLLRVLTQQNVFLISKMCYFCFGLEKDFEYNVYLFFIEGELRKHLGLGYDPAADPGHFRQLTSVIDQFRGRVPEDILTDKLDRLLNKFDKNKLIRELIKKYL